MPADMRITWYDNYNFRKKQTDNTKVTTINVSTLVILPRGEMPKQEQWTLNLQCLQLEMRFILCMMENKQHGRAKKWMRRGQLEEIVASVNTRNILLDTFVISSGLVRKRSERQSLVVANKNGKGAIFPLLLYKSGFLTLSLRRIESMVY